MNVLQLSSESSWRGGEQQIAYLIEELQKKGIKPLIAGRPNSAFSKVSKERSWEFIDLRMKNSLDISSAVKLKKICKERNIDLIHVHSSRSHGIAYLAYLLGNKTKIILSRRVDFPPKRSSISIHKYNIPVIRRIACVSNAIQEMVRPILKNKQIITTIYSGIDHSKFKHTAENWLRNNYQLDEETVIIGNTSALADHKDYFTFIDTAKIFRSKFPDLKTKFFIIGSGPLESEIKQYAEKQQMNNDIIFTGFLKNINSVLPALDLFFISSKTEGLGTSILDAFACKVPVLATEAGGIPEIVQNEQTGLSAAVGAAEKLAIQLHRLIQDSELQTRVVNNAYERSLELSKENMAEAYFTVYKEVLHEE